MVLPPWLPSPLAPPVVQVALVALVAAAVAVPVLAVTGLAPLMVPAPALALQLAAQAPASLLPPQQTGTML